MSARSSPKAAAHLVIDSAAVNDPKGSLPSSLTITRYSLMDSTKLNEWLQVVGLFGVIASLLFVGLQMKQDREIALSTATQARTETTIQNILGIASNPILATALDKIELGESNLLTASERRAFTLSARATLYNLENSHYQYTAGFIAEEKWTASRESLKDILRRSYGARAAYEANPASWRESFQNVVDELILEIDSEVASQQ